MVFDFEESVGVWFDYPGGGRIQLRLPTVDDYVRIDKESNENRPYLHEAKDKPPVVLNHRIPDPDKAARLLNDCTIIAWEDFLDKNGKPIPCNIDAKNALMRMKDPAFRDFVNAKLKALDEAGKAAAEEAEKNS
ncbi:MAG: hypothetical protein ABFD62_04615 [Syntrophaceae bacterium]